MTLRLRNHLFLHQKNSQHLIQRFEQRNNFTADHLFAIHRWRCCCSGTISPSSSAHGACAPPPHINPKGTLQHPCASGSTGSRAMLLAATRGLAQGTVPNVCRQKPPQPWGLPWVGQGGVWWRRDPPSPACTQPQACGGGREEPAWNRQGQTEQGQGLWPLRPSPLCSRTP